MCIMSVNIQQSGEKNTVTSSSVGRDFFREWSPAQQQRSPSSTSLPPPPCTPGKLCCPPWVLLLETPGDFALFVLTLADSIFSQGTVCIHLTEQKSTGDGLPVDRGKTKVLFLTTKHTFNSHGQSIPNFNCWIAVSLNLLIKHRKFTLLFLQ